MSRLGKALIAALVAVVLLVVFSSGSLSRFADRFFEIKGVQLTGEIKHVSPAHFKRALGQSTVGTFFSVDIDTVRERALSAPWVKNVEVRRVWPNRIRIDIEEYQALARWEDGRFVSVEGVLFAANQDEADNFTSLPEFFGAADKVKELTRRYKRFTKMLQVVIPTGRVTQISVTDRNSWVVVIAAQDIPETPVELGTEREEWTLEERFGVVVVQYAEVKNIMGWAPAAIDARYDNAFSVTSPTNVR